MTSGSFKLYLWLLLEMRGICPAWCNNHRMMLLIVWKLRAFKNRKGKKRYFHHLNILQVESSYAMVFGLIVSKSWITFWISRTSLHSITFCNILLAITTAKVGLMHAPSHKTFFRTVVTVKVNMFTLHGSSACVVRTLVIRLATDSIRDASMAMANFDKYFKVWLLNIPQ